MRRERWIGFFLAVIVTFMLSLAGAGCLATAFELGEQADMVHIAFWCAIVSVLACLLSTLHIGWAMPCLIAVLAVFLWEFSVLKESFMALLHTISVYCNKGYGWGILNWKNFDPDAVACTMALQSIASIVAMFCGWSICEKRGCTWAILAALAAFAPCTLVLFSVPDTKYLFLWLATIVFLLLTQSVRIQNERQGNRAMLGLFVPVMLACALLFALLPRDTYDGRARAEALLSKIRPYLNLEEYKGNTTSDAIGVDLLNINAPDDHDGRIMTVYTSERGIYYLRARSYDIYTGTSWYDSGEACDLPWQSCGEHFASIRVQTAKIESIRYLPYITPAMIADGAESFTENSDQSMNYLYQCYRSGELNGVDVSEESIAALTELPPQTLAWAKQYLRKLYGDRNYYAMAIAAHVRASARYDLSAPTVGEESDFAQWFLEQSDTGYCVHFATAAAVLLRASGIPCRYVTGYLVDMRRQNISDVYQTDAHAWVEYWTEKEGWQVLEATPSQYSEYVPQTSQQPTVETTEPSTQEPTKTQESTSTSAAMPEMTEPSEKPTIPTQSVTTESTEPSQTVALQNDAEHTVSSEPYYEAKEIPRPVKWTFAFLALLILTLGQWKCRMVKMMRKLKSGHPNERALQYWVQIVHCCKILRLRPEQAVYSLIRKAKFSQHTITEEELSYLQNYLERCINKLRNRPWYKRIYDRFVRALY